MDSENLPRLIYLGILLIAVGGWVFAETRHSIGKSIRMLMAWGLIFLGLIAGYGLWEDVRRDLAPRQTVLQDGSAVQVPRGPGGHYFLDVNVGGTTVKFIVDTGATDVVLTLDDARAVGIDTDNLPFLGVANTANGPVKTAFSTVNFMSIGPVRYSRVRVAINGGEMRESLLGMSFLSRFEKIEIGRDGLTLTP
ncbi:TIGR02281 family clan AA aspartic protease [Rhodobacteraceae bacterium]|nr:TIGR02281 family clan AA aspartic protease [Paracoccaceae bacterium]